MSHRRLKTLGRDLGNSDINHWEQTGVLVPSQAANGVFTNGAFDNIDHAMEVNGQTTHNLDPGQKPVMVADQPLFILVRKLQWKYPHTVLGEDSFLVTLGPMHTEMLWSVSGEW